MPAGSRDVKGGGRKGSTPSTSPINSMLPLPTPSPAARIKLSARQSMVASSSMAAASSSATARSSNASGTGKRVGRPRKNAAMQRAQPGASSSGPSRTTTAKSKSRYLTDSETSESELSDLSSHPSDVEHFVADHHYDGLQDDDDLDGSVLEDVDEDEDDDMMGYNPSKKSNKVTTPRKRNSAATQSATTTPTRKGKGKAADTKLSAAATTTTKKKVAKSGKEPVEGKVTVTGPAGRERKRNVRLGEQERRRARDEKFGVGGTITPSVTSPTPRINLYHDDNDDDGASSYGDDESGPDGDNVDIYGHFIEDDSPTFDFDLATIFGIPSAFAGQEIEDLEYGAGAAQSNSVGNAAAPFGPVVEDEDDDMLITQLSGSEADRQSQSTLHSDTDELMSDSDMSDSTSDGGAHDEFGVRSRAFDEFGLPAIRADANNEDNVDPPLVVMQNWAGEFILVEPRVDRTRKRRSSRTTGGTGSVSGSTVLSAQDKQGLLIDPDVNEDDQGAILSDESSEWSGPSDEEDGDTTDSMAEEDMPMLDSPALASLIEQQVGFASNAAISPMPIGSPEPLLQNPVAPSIVVTDTSIPHTPAPSVSSGGTPALPGPVIPQTPGPSASVAPIMFAPPPPSIQMPVMGSFRPTTDHPAHQAVIDGSKTTTRSPFTHRRKTKKGRAGSMSSMGTGVGTPGAVFEGSPSAAPSSASKAKRRSHSTTGGNDPFASPRGDAATNAAAAAQRRAARYSSIPGHPRYRAAQQRVLEMEEETASEEEAEEGMHMELELEDMLEASALAHQHSRGRAGGPANNPEDGQPNGMYRYDPFVHKYMRQNINSSARGRGGAAAGARIVQAHMQGSPMAMLPNWAAVV